MFFDNWADLVRVAVIGVLAYGGLVVILRVSGKRTLSKMNAFDLVVTVALGSTLATVLLFKSVALAEGLLAFAVLVSLQFVVTWSSARSSAVSRLVKNEPKLLFYEGCYLRDAMGAERLTEEAVEAAVRQQGIADLEKVGAAVLETDGSVTVVPRQADLGSASALRSVGGQSVVLVATLMIVLTGCSEQAAGDRAATVGLGTTMEGCPGDGGACADANPNAKPVPNVVGMPVLAACRELRPEGYRGAVVGEVGDGESGPSRVLAQEPEAGHKGYEGQLVRLTVSEPYPAGVLEQNPECLDRTQFGPGGKPNEPT
jgi:uncharacterized membrane protein YcaP (DUF421 family)